MNRIRGLLLVGMLLTTAVLPIQAYAQSATAIKYGDVAKGEITASKASLSFTFKAAANDMVVLKMKQDGLDSNVAPSLAVTDSTKKTVADTTQQTTYSSATLVFAVTAAGTYTIVAGTTDPTKIGKFQLLLSKAQVLKSGQASIGHASTEQPAYFTYTSGDPFTISYAKSAGDFTPDVNVNKVADDKSLTQVAYIGGSLINAGSLTVNPGTSQTFVVSVESALFDFNTKVTADFTLQVDIAK